MSEIMIAGFGGQGILAAGVMLANAGLLAGLQTTWLPSYGATMRGGTANCFVKIDSEEIVKTFEEEGVRDWSTIKTTLKDDLRDYIFQRTKRNPMIMAVVMPV